LLTPYDHLSLGGLVTDLGSDEFVRTEGDFIYFNESIHIGVTTNGCFAEINDGERYRLVAIGVDHFYPDTSELRCGLRKDKIKTG
jgi:hypothetical protein